MPDDIDTQTEHVQHRAGARLYTRCNHCGMFYQMDAGTQCPDPKCKGTMV